MDEARAELDRALVSFGRLSESEAAFRAAIDKSVAHALGVGDGALRTFWADRNHKHNESSSFSSLPADLQAIIVQNCMRQAFDGSVAGIFGRLSSITRAGLSCRSFFAATQAATSVITLTLRIEDFRLFGSTGPVYGPGDGIEKFGHRWQLVIRRKEQGAGPISCLAIALVIDGDRPHPGSTPVLAAARLQVPGYPKPAGVLILAHPCGGGGAGSVWAGRNWTPCLPFGNFKAVARVHIMRAR